MTDRRRNGFILLLVLGLIIASAAAVVAKKTRLGLDLKGGVELVYQGKPTPQQPKVDAAAMDRAVDIIRERVDKLGVAEPEIQRSGPTQISVGLPDVKNAQRAQQQVGTTAQLYFYDWETNVIGPDGTPQPTDATVTETPLLNIFSAVQRAAKRPPQRNLGSSIGDQWYLFSKDNQLISGPEDTQKNLFSELPRQAKPVGSKVFKINQGTTIVEADKADNAPKNTPARYYVIRDQPALTGRDIKNPKQEFDSGAGGTGAPIVTMDFTGKGRKAFQKVTREIAQRGQQSQTPGQPAQSAFQHFAVVLDNKIVSRPYIDFNQNPDGIDGRTGAQISGGFTITSAQDLANFLKIGALPIRLELISQSQVSSTLGKQALHQGLIAGLVGFILVAIFLIAIYRVLGLIAVGALLIYALYFYALIKLIPITMTLPGIAGLILTIGVAADANIVIFERIKEEIRAGRSIPAGIAAGYKKGFSTIVDANVVTIMTAFILFILATAGVKGFAFTLGVGVIVSLFTAVLATQAILGTMARSKLISSPSALGAGTLKHERFHWDFMGASKWFFSMSGTILIIGALAIGGKGLNLGIDFESGTRIKTNLEQKANVEQVRSVLAGAGYADAKIQSVKDPKLGANVVQISTPTLSPPKVNVVRSKLDQRFGVGNSFSSQSIGPTFGQTVAKQALIAIIASLLVISLYIALRFEWKFAVPVLIALMHDILITGGVYALTGREVTVSTVAALLTILGFSLYDTIIVFDRVRENVPRMPRATFSQIVNRSMSEVLARSLATTFSTALPILCLLLFGGDTLKDFAFALLIGTVSGAYSSIFIASPVLTHWKEREPLYARRHERVARENGGIVPAYALATVGGAPVDVPVAPKARRQRRITEPVEPDQISPEEFDDLVRDLHPEPADPTADATPEEVVMPSARRANGDPKPKREKQKRPRNRRHGRAR